MRKNQDYIPVLTYRLPLKNSSGKLLCDVPAGHAIREDRQIDVPVLTGACVVSEKTTAALICDCKYGFRLADDVLSVTFLNTACDPDPYPERGIHAVKLFVALTDGNATALKRTGETLIRPMIGVPTGCHPGKLPAKNSFLGFEAAHSVLTSMQIADDDALMIRLYENAGAPEEIVIRAPFAPSKAVLTDLNEKVLAAAAVDGDSVRFEIGAHRIAQVKIYR